jgi:hypothetical protein
VSSFVSFFISARLLDPLLRRQCKAVETGLHFNPVEFDGIKAWVIEFLPNTKKFYRVPISEPIPYKVVSAIGVLKARNVRNADVVILLMGEDGNGSTLNLDDAFFVFAHLKFSPFRP